jgi:hypothetical protein
VFPGSVLVGAITVGGAHLPSGSVTFPGSITAGPATVAGAFVPSTLQIFPGSVVAASTQEVGGAFIDSTAQVFPGLVQPKAGTCVKSDVSVRCLVTGATLGPTFTVCSDGVKVKYLGVGAIDCTNDGVVAEVSVRTRVTADIEFCC